MRLSPARCGLAVVAALAAACGGRSGLHQPVLPEPQLVEVAIDAASPLVADGATTASVRVRVLDAEGHEIPGLAVEFAWSGRQNQATPSRVQAGAGGAARTSLATTAAEEKTLSAKILLAGSDRDLGEIARLRFVPGPAASSRSELSISQTMAPNDGVTPVELVAVARDVHGNPVPKLLLRLAATGSGAAIEPGEAVSDEDGRVRARLTSTRAETKTVSAAAVVGDVPLPLATAEVTFVGRPHLEGLALFHDLDDDGRCGGGDTIRLPFDQGIVLDLGRDGGSSTALFSLPVAGDALGENPLARLGPSGRDIDVGLGDRPVIRTRGGFAPDRLAPGAASGIGLDVAATQGAILGRLGGLAARESQAIGIVPAFVASRRPLPPVAGRRLAAADLDGDGDTDLLVARDDGDVIELWNDGSGGYAAGSIVPGTAGVLALVIADFDRDGDADLVTADARAGVRMFVATASGWTQAGPALWLPGPTDLALADPDRDGVPDVVLGTQTGVELLRNDRPGLSYRELAPIASGAKAVAVGDLDRDGWDDVVAATSSGLTLVRADGRGRLDSPTPAPFEGDVASLQLADLDADGALDAVLGCADGRIAVLHNDGRGGLMPAVVHDLRQPVTAVVAVDHDRDGTVDLVAFAGGRGHLLLRRGGEVRLAQVFDCGEVADAVLLDADRDGDRDLLVAARDAVGVSLADEPALPLPQLRRFSSSLAGTWGPLDLAASPRAFVGPTPQGGRAVAGDIDHDGDADLLIAAAGTGTVVWRNGRDRDWVADPSILGPGDYVQGLVLADLDRDGDLDLVTANAVQQPLGIYLNDGSGLFTEAGAVGSGWATSVAAGDVDGDGDVDLVVGRLVQRGARSAIHVNDGSGRFLAAPVELGDVDVRSVGLADLDRDGDLDVIAGGAGQATRVWRNDGGLRFSDSGQRIGQGYATALATGDVDGDGDADLVLGYDFQNPARLFLNDGRGLLVDSQRALGAGRVLAVALSDLDGDGDLDLVLSEFGGQDHLLRNDGKGDFVPAAAFAGGGSEAVVVADFDLDGDADLVLVGSGQIARILAAR